MSGQMIKEKREAAGLSQVALAEKLMITQPRLAHIEMGYKPPTVAIIKMAAEIFGCTTDELIFGEKRGA